MIVREGSIPSQVLDVLETHVGHWFTFADLHREMLRSYPGVGLQSMCRAAHRLARAGILDSRFVWVTVRQYNAEHQAHRVVEVRRTQRAYLMVTPDYEVAV